MGNLISYVFPCMTGATSESPNTTITIKSTSACCRGKIIKIKINDDNKKEFEETIKKLIDKFEIDKNNISSV